MVKARLLGAALATLFAFVLLDARQIIIRNANDCDNRPSPASCGTPTLVQHVAGAMENNNGNGVPSITAQLANPSLSGNALVLCVQMDQPGGVGVTISDDKSNTWTTGPVRVGTNQTLSLFYALNATVGTRAVTMTFSGATKPNNVQASMSEFYNVATSSAADGSTGASSTTPIAAGSFTPTTNGDLIYHCGVDDANPGTYNGGTVTAGSGFTLLNADRQVGTAAQYQVQSVAASINPTFTVGADQWDSVAIALKSASAGTAPSPGIRIVHVQHSLIAWTDNAGRPDHPTPVVLQFPSSGNLLVGLFNHSGYLLTAVTDSASNAWASAVSQLDSPAQVVSSQIVYAANATTSATLNNLTFTFNHAVDAGHAMIVLYDITGASSSPLGATHSSQGLQSVNADLAMDTITPTTANGLVFNVGSIWGHTTNGTSGVSLFDAWVNPIDNNAGGTIQTPASYLDMDNPYAHYANPDTSAVTFTYSFNGTPPPTGIQQWSSVSAEFLNGDDCTANVALTQSAIQSALNAATNGAIICLPSGNLNLSSPITATVTASNVTLMGQNNCTGAVSALTCDDATSLTDNYASNNAILDVTANGSGTFRISGIEFKGGSGSVKDGGGFITIAGSNTQVRVDHNHFDKRTYSPQNNGKIMVVRVASGVFDHNMIHFGTGIGWVHIVNGTSDGDPEWAAATNFGGSNFWFLEDNRAISDEDSNHRWLGTMTDCHTGGRFVIRYNYLEAVNVSQTHPTGHSGHDRGCRAHETYGNTIITSSTWNPATDEPLFAMDFNNSGPGLVWNNSMDGVYKSVLYFNVIRQDAGTYNPGAMPTLWGPCGSGFDGTGSVWDGNTDSSGYPCLDQPGRGIGDALSGDFSSERNDTRGCTVNFTWANRGSNCDGSDSSAWPRQALEPIYEWLNVGNFVSGWGGSGYVNNPAGTSRMQENRDYYLYRNNTSCNQGAGSCTAGVGSGTVSQRPTSCTTGVGWWATDQGGNWNTTNGSANDGALYKCTATNTWTLYYTPLTYPHPLVQ